MFEFLGPIIGGLGSLASGISSAFRPGIDNSQATNFAREQLQFQRDAAQMGIRWRVADAKAAGVHPLYAMGAQAFNPSPVPFPVGDAPPDVLGSLGQMGQNVGRAIAATQSKHEREITDLDLLTASQGAASRALDLEMKQLQLQSMRAQLARDQIGPPLPSTAGAPGTGISESKPNEVITGQPDAPSIGAGLPGPVSTYHRVGNGLQAFPAKGVQGLDDMDATNALGIDWLVRNRLAPAMGARDLAPTMAQVRAHFPNATGVRFDPNSLKWIPTYNGSRHPGPRPEKLFRYTRPSGSDNTWTGAP